MAKSPRVSYRKIQHLSQFLIDDEKHILLMRNKLGIFTSFVKAMEQTGAGLVHLHQTFPSKNDTKLKDVILLDQEIRKLINDAGFVKI